MVKREHLRILRMIHWESLFKMRFRLNPLLYLIAALLTSLPSTAFPGNFTAFGPQNYTRGTASPVVVTNAFTVLNPNTSYTLKINNSGLTDAKFEKISSAVISLNGVQIVGPNEFNQNVTLIEKPITLATSNQLSVELRGKPGGGITIQIIGVDNDPPTITASVNPFPNAAGWHKTDVTVSFTCSDMTSGIASCPGPMSVSTEGANQVVSGTAVDRAGNTASTSVTLNIDKTPPTLSPTITPQPNLAGWNHSDVTVSFTCTDATSGIAVCPSPVTVNAEGTNQIVSGTATDLAGNSASTSVSISLDKTAPTVAITSPSNGATVSSSPVNVTGTATDSLSGIATVFCNGSAATLSVSSFSCDVPLTNGPNTITVEATDIAGNKVSSTITVNLGQPLEPQSPPVVFGPRIFTQPNEAVSFLVTNPVGPFWLQVRNGEAVPIVGAEPGVVDMQNLVTGGTIVLNGSLVATASDFDHNTTLQFGFQKDVTLTSVNTLEVQLQGPAGSFITVQIREADPNPVAGNAKGDLGGWNMGDQVVLKWSIDDRAAEYILFRSTSIAGPWEELDRIEQETARTGGSIVDVTPDARLMDLCYKVDALDAFGQVVRIYEPICVPKFVETQAQSFTPRRYSPDIRSASLFPSTRGTKQTLQQSVSAGFTTNFVTVNGHKVGDSVVTESSTLAICVDPEGNYSNGRDSGKEISKEAQGILKPELNRSFLTYQTWEADPNPVAGNAKGDLGGWNMGDQVVLKWSIDDRAAEYILFRSTSIAGPWEELDRIEQETARTGGSIVDVTPDARLKDLCYRVDALDAKGKLVRSYEPICVPKFIERKKEGLKRDDSKSVTKAVATEQNLVGNQQGLLRLASLVSLQAEVTASSGTKDALCFGNPDPEFTDFRSMGLVEIDEFLERHGGYLGKPIKDVDGVPIDPALTFFEQAENNQINPQVLLITLLKESRSILGEERPDPAALRIVMGCGSPSTIRGQIKCAATTTSENFDRLKNGLPTLKNGWQVGVPKGTGNTHLKLPQPELDSSGNPITVTPENKPTAILYSYTPWAGVAFGGGRRRPGGKASVGGNGLFCRLWDDFQFRRQPVAISPQNPTLTCPDGSVTFTASGGRAGPDGYSWSVSNRNARVTVTGVNKENMELRPPETENKFPGRTAYIQIGNKLDPPGCEIPRYVISTSAVARDCNNRLLSSGSQGGCADFCGGASCINASCTTCGPSVCSDVEGACGGLPACPNGSEPYLASNPGAGFCCDVRDQDMKNNRCLPCAPEMQGVAVKITDAAGAEATTAITAQ